MSHKKPAILVLADGTKFRGNSIGVDGYTVGEVVFNTAMTGYQEILTDPSYTEQLVCLTYPHIGNTGTNLEDIESPKINASGLIIKDLPIYASNFRKKYTLAQYCENENLVAIADIDTRELTRHIRKNGAQAGCICVSSQEEKALEMARKFPGLSGMDLAKVVTTSKKYSVTEGEWSLGLGYESKPKSFLKIAAYDFGVKKNILRMLVSRGCEVEVFPANFPIEDILKLKPDGVFLSNGPGDPEPCDYAIKNIKTLLNKKIPTFGICLGHQLLAIAAGAKTKKMKFGHHGANHPVQDLQSKKVFITSQNHGFTVDDQSLPNQLEVTHLSLFDNTIQGIKIKNIPAFSFQGHPEASPGPSEMSYLFDRFISLMLDKKGS
ncbi:MAG: glutamine-hydrolyzing carbamoyl-phosphate synthase small subunit [Methylophilaceae bacterium]